MPFVINPYIYSAASYFKTATYTGTGANQSFTGCGFQPDLIFTKRSVGGSQTWNVQDSTRGISESLAFDSSNATLTGLSNYVTSFDADGFSIGNNSLVNTNTSTYQYWAFKKAPLVMDIVSYTGNATNRTIAHSLGVTPNFIIIKRRSGSALWTAYHDQVTGTATKNFNWDATSGLSLTTDSTVFNDTTPTSSVFSVGTSNQTNANTSTYIAYLFANVTGAVSIGQYTGNGSSSGPSVTCGFLPSALTVFRASGTGLALPTTYGTDQTLSWVDTGTVDSSDFVDFTATGFNIKTTSGQWNGSALPYCYIAWK